MADYNWRDGSQGFDRYWDLGKYQVTSVDAEGATLTFDTGLATFDPTQWAWRVELQFSSADIFTKSTGPDAGDDAFRNGNVVSMTYFSATDEELLSVTKLAGKLILASDALMTGVGLDDLYGIINRGGHSYFGSNDASGPDTTNDGDVFLTGQRNDFLQGKNGDDYAYDFGGRDTYRMGGGWDTLDYSASSEIEMRDVRGIVVNLLIDSIRGFDNNIDLAVGVEAVVGTYRNDRFIGSNSENRFAGLSGADTIDGMRGYDEADYSLDAQKGGTIGIVVDLAAGTANDGFGTVDKLISIEGIIATDFEDDLTDNGRNNYFWAGTGADIVRLSGGSDVVNLGIADGAADTLIVRGADFGDNVIFGFSKIEGDKIDIEAAPGFDDLIIWQDGDDAVIEYGGDTVKLIDVTAGTLEETDFLF